MVESTKPAKQPQEPPPAERFRTLPEPVRLEDTIATHPSAPPPDPSMNRDPDQDFLLRNAAG